MTKPSEIVTWATDANYAADGDSWGGTPTKVDPGAARRAEGIEPDTFPAQWMNYHLNALGKHVEYVEGVLEATDTIPSATRTFVLPASAMQWIASSAGTDPLVGLTSGGTAFQDGHRILIPSTEAAVLGVLALNRLVPHGATNLQVDLMITPGTHTTPGRFSLMSYTPNWTTPSVPATHTEHAGDDTSGTAIQVLSVSHATALDSGVSVYYVCYDPKAMSGGADLLHALRIRYTDPGPRNF